MRRPNPPAGLKGRRGSILPAIIFALGVTLCVIALVLNRLWIDTARTELQRVADACALAAGRALVSDDLLRAGANPAGRVLDAKSAAGDLALEHVVAGTPVSLNLEDDGDVRFGRLVTDDEGRTVFVETQFDPQTVVVTARRSQEHANPLGTLMSNAAHQDSVDVTCRSEASISNAAVALRAGSSFDVPAFPLAILQVDPTGRQPITWATQIDARGGPDVFTYNEKTGKVTPGPDGISEIILNGVDPNQPPNACLIDVGTSLNPGDVSTQIRQGWSEADLKKFGGDVNCVGASFASTPIVTTDQLTAFREMKGQARAVMLYASPAPEATSAAGIVCTGCVAGRVMEVIAVPGGGAFRIVFQPAVLVTRAVVLDVESGAPAGVPNKYLYKLTLTQ